MCQTDFQHSSASQCFIPSVCSKSSSFSSRRSSDVWKLSPVGGWHFHWQVAQTAQVWKMFTVTVTSGRPSTHTHTHCLTDSCLLNKVTCTSILSQGSTFWKILKIWRYRDRRYGNISPYTWASMLRWLHQRSRQRYLCSLAKFFLQQKLPLCPGDRQDGRKNGRKKILPCVFLVFSFFHSTCSSPHGRLWKSTMKGDGKLRQ